ncbi:T3SS effector HopA1 family protein [Rhodococcus sp. NPDC127530]|uniref:T3SS effector HopA1 family protein n=1 Tax=unclassified Rhodococcus (in: high G+C Gram-positive bacteria) TaxID=192944 RepID=UPI0036443C19
MEATDAPDDIERLLRERVYARCHLLDATAVLDRSVRLAEDMRFVEQMRRKLVGRSYADGGWKLIASRTGVVLAEKNGLRLFPQANEIMELNAGSGQVSVELPSERRYAIPGFFAYVSIHGDLDESRTWRLYVNLRQDSAAAAFLAIIDELENRHVRFQIKVVNHPDRFTRPDSMTLYVGEADLNSVLKITRRVLSERFLAGPTPGFSSRLGPGRALAPELHAAGTSTSFGHHCSGIVAASLLEAHKLGLHDEDARAHHTVRAVRTALADAGCPTRWST